MALANVNSTSFASGTQIIVTGMSATSAANNWLAVGVVTVSGITIYLIDSVTYINVVSPLVIPSSAGYTFCVPGFNFANGILTFAITNGTQTILYQTNVGLFVAAGQFITPADLTQLSETNFLTLTSPIQTVNALSGDNFSTLFLLTTNNNTTYFAQKYTMTNAFPGSFFLDASITFNPATDPNTWTGLAVDVPNFNLYAFATNFGGTSEVVIVKIPYTAFTSYSTLNLGSTDGPINSSAIDCSFLYVVQSSLTGILVSKIDTTTFTVVNTLTCGTSATLTTAQDSANLYPSHLIIAAYDSTFNISSIFDIDTDTFTLVDTLTLPGGATSVQGSVATNNNFGFTTTPPNQIFQFSGVADGGSGQYQGGGGVNSSGTPPNYGVPTTACTACETVIPRESFRCSLSGNQLVTVTVNNNTDCNIDFIWSSYACQQVYYFTVTANSSFNVHSYVTHVFKFYLNNSNQLIYELPPLSGDTTVTFNCNSTVVTTKAIILSLYPAVSNVGDTVIIYGSGFTGTTSVLVNGVSATFTVIDDNAISIIIPVGATTGRITVITPGGSTNSPEDAIIHPPYAPEFTQVVTV